MYDLKDRTYAVLEVVTIGYYNYIETKKNKFQVRLNFPTIIEMAAVKIKNGKIVGNYSTFVNIDGCDEYDLKFDNDPEFDGITAEHLIGTPSLNAALNDLFNFTEGRIV